MMDARHACTGCRRRKSKGIRCRSCNEMFCQHFTSGKIDEGKPREQLTGLPVGPITGICTRCRMR